MASLNRSGHHDTLIDVAVKRMASLPFGTEPVEHVGDSLLQAGVGFYGPSKEHVGHAFRLASVLAGTKGAVTVPADYFNSSSLARRLQSRLIADGHQIRKTAEGVSVVAGGPTKTQPKATYARAKKEQPSYSDLVLHAAKVLDDPLDNTAVLTLADHLAENYPEHPAVNAFMNWVSNPGTPFDKDAARLFRNSKFVVFGRTATNGLPRGQVAMEPSSGGSHDVNGFRKTAGKKGKWKVTAPPPNPVDDFYVPTSESVDSKHAANHILEKGGVESLLHVLIGLRMYHPKREGGALVPGQTRLGQITFSRQKYSREDGVAHPLVRNFRIEHALRRLSTDETATDDVRRLATTALYGNPEKPDDVDSVTGAVHALHDALQESGHPLRTKLDRKGKTLGGYNWLRASYKLHHDAAVSHAVNVLRGTSWGAAEPNREYVNAFFPIRDLERALTPPEHLEHLIQFDQAPSARAVEAVATLRSAGLKDRDIRESLHRVRMRASDTLDRFGMSALAETPEHLAMYDDIADGIVKAGQEGRKRSKSNVGYTNVEGEQASLYNRRVDTFVNAVRRMESRTQETLRLLASKAVKKFKLTPKKLTNAVYDDGKNALPHVVQQVSHPDREHVKAAAALLGLQSNAPAMGIFHVDPDGPDALHAVKTTGSGERLRGLLDTHGIPKRVMTQTTDGWTVLVFDPGRKRQSNMNAFAQAIGSPLKTVIGVGEVLGGSGPADDESRHQFRSILRQAEQRQQEQNNAAVPTVVGNAGPFDH